eukprot:gnl/MRDRNA2_/MRDRNA2_267817_c0_seq1.p1 gnl/MRDRNA2_/MRDRNA2_267817_c0~~gnl/MRDRNA2_/MRDRNA2_267817_c0_seq1.p1  ORF type:complete len:143 (+),score=26.66 gnl/MRDRNA2_/MRDRNA2_267817_c0_seq1:62-490(+)
MSFGYRACSLAVWSATVFYGDAKDLSSGKFAISVKSDGSFVGQSGTGKQLEFAGGGPDSSSADAQVVTIRPVKPSVEKDDGLPWWLPRIVLNWWHVLGIGIVLGLMRFVLLPRDDLFNFHSESTVDGKVSEEKHNVGQKETK